MAQEYNAILPGGSTNILQDNIDSRKNEEALRSGFSGSAFPTSPVPVAGQRCYREDLKKEYIFNGESWVEVASSGAIAQEVTLARGTHTKLQDRLGVSMNPDGTLKTPATANVDEFKVSGFTPTYISTNSFSVPGDMRAIFTENRRLKVTQGAETIYTAVVSASYDDVSDKTTIVIDNITITNKIAAVDFSLVQYGLPANLDAGTLNGKSDTAFQEVAEKDQPGGYAGLDNNGAINSKIRSTVISDFNDATVGGHYYWGSNTINAPVPGAGGTALVIDRRTSGGGVYQQAADWYGVPYVRAYAGGTWKEWKRIDAATWGSISGTLSDQTDLQTALNGKVDTSPSMTGSATLNGTTNNTVQLTNIVTTLGLEVGDVIRIQYSGYNKLHTVESITNNNLIVVNYEHAGNRGNGSLKLANTTATVTITRIAKWYNAPIGLGQAWVDVTGSRAKSVTYTNSTGKPILVHVQKSPASITPLTLTVGSLVVSRFDGYGAETQAAVTAIVPHGSTYIVGGTGKITYWVELR